MGDKNRQQQKTQKPKKKKLSILIVYLKVQNIFLIQFSAMT